MSFTSIEFIIFFAIVLLTLVFSQLPFAEKRLNSKSQIRLKNIILIFFSYTFYAWWDWRFCFLLLFLTLTAYVSAKNISKNKCVTFFKFTGVAIPLIILGFFKYYNFFVDSFCGLFEIKNAGVLNIILPLGISFYTFQSMSYTIDVLRGKLVPAKFEETALYVAFFPQLLSGPIVKASFFLPQIKENRKITLKNLEIGAQIFLFGMFKKVVLADRLSVFVDDVYFAPSAYSSLTVVFAVVAYSLQIYFDFSGYSDMAIGCAKCIGFDLPANFNLPYMSKNPTEFWKRWHISLSSWLQEYLYISLGGNRKGTLRTYFNLLITMILGGLWHGANWTFVVWGALHGVALCIHKIFRKALKTPKNKESSGFKAIASIILNFIFVSLCWIFFRADSFEKAIEILGKVFVWSDGLFQPYTWFFAAVVLIMLYTLYCKFQSRRDNLNNQKTSSKYIILNLNTFVGLVVFFVAAMLTLGLAYTNSNPFIYFQF